MHTLRIATLLLLHTFSPSYRGDFVSAEALSNVELLPNELGLRSFEDFEILSYHEEGDEDVYHIRKRANNNENDKCGETDCWNYSGWTTDEKMISDDESEPDGGLQPLKERSLQKRDQKPPMQICSKLDFVLSDGTKIPEEGFTINSPTWRGVEELEKKYQMVYDIGDPSKPNKADWFKLTLHKQRWPTDVHPSKTTRVYNAEHVLEWALLREFIEADKNNGDASRCAIIFKYFIQEDMARKNIDVQVARDYKKTLNTADDRLEFETKKFEWSKFRAPPKSAQTRPRPIDYVAFQWPGSDGGSPPSPWEYELILLNADTNIKKENVWSGKNIFREPILDAQGQMKKNKENSNTLEALFANKYWENQVEKKWADNKGKCKAVYNYNNVMGIAQYHNDFYIKEVMRAQVRRVAAAWEYLEENVVKDKEWIDSKGQKHRYKKQNLKDQWIKWIKDIHNKRLTRLNESLDKKIEIFEKKSATKRWDYLGVFKRAAKKDEPDCGSEPNDNLMKERVKLLVAAKKGLQKVDPVLDLDEPTPTPTPTPTPAL